MKLPFPIALLILLHCSIFAAEEEAKPTKPEIVVRDDGFPFGQATPEGAACDLARAFIDCDVDLFRKTCIAPFGGGESRDAYEQFLENVAASIEAEAKKETLSPEGPKNLGKVFAARHLSRNGPASAGYALHSFEDIMFVDVGCELVSGERSLIRTMVIRKKDGSWYVHPAPYTSTLLSSGLNDEDASTIDFSEVYTVKQAGDADQEESAEPAAGGNE